MSHTVVCECHVGVCVFMALVFLALVFLVIRFFSCFIICNGSLALFPIKTM